MKSGGGKGDLTTPGGIKNGRQWQGSAQLQPNRKPTSKAGHESPICSPLAAAGLCRPRPAAAVPALRCGGGSGHSGLLIIAVRKAQLSLLLLSPAALPPRAHRQAGCILICHCSRLQCSCHVWAGLGCCLPLCSQACCDKRLLRQRRQSLLSGSQVCGQCGHSIQRLPHCLAAGWRFPAWAGHICTCGWLRLKHRLGPCTAAIGGCRSRVLHAACLPSLSQRQHLEAFLQLLCTLRLLLLGVWYDHGRGGGRLLLLLLLILPLLLLILQLLLAICRCLLRHVLQPLGRLVVKPGLRGSAKVWRDGRSTLCRLRCCMGCRCTACWAASCRSTVP